MEEENIRHRPYKEQFDYYNPTRKGGRTAPIRTEPKIQRNQPCPCFSGKKYKNCCMKKKG